MLTWMKWHEKCYCQEKRLENWSLSVDKVLTNKLNRLSWRARQSISITFNEMCVVPANIWSQVSYSFGHIFIILNNSLVLFIAVLCEPFHFFSDFLFSKITTTICTTIIKRKYIDCSAMCLTQFFFLSSSFPFCFYSHFFFSTRSYSICSTLIAISTFKNRKWIHRLFGYAQQL